jgi:hypothetical protein
MCFAPTQEPVQKKTFQREPQGGCPPQQTRPSCGWHGKQERKTPLSTLEAAAAVRCLLRAALPHGGGAGSAAGYANAVALWTATSVIASTLFGQVGPETRNKSAQVWRVQWFENLVRRPSDTHASTEYRPHVVAKVAGGWAADPRGRGGGAAASKGVTYAMPLGAARQWPLLRCGAGAGATAAEATPQHAPQVLSADRPCDQPAGRRWVQKLCVGVRWRPRFSRRTQLETAACAGEAPHNR